MAEVNINDKLLSVSTSPHLRSEDSISKIMWTVNMALAPAALFGAWHFGINAFLVMLVSAGSAVLFEYLVQKLRKKPVTIKDGSAFLTGLLLAMCLPPSVPLYMPVVGTFIAIVIAKHSMGGLGYNIFNPAHIGRAALMVSWPVLMTTWTKLTVNVNGVDVVTSATPLNVLKQQGHDALINMFGSSTAMYTHLFLGTRNGSIGETSTVLLVLGGVFLIWKKIVKWEIPVAMIATVGLFTWIFGPAGLFTGDPLFHMMAGGLIIGAFFMATDMVTAPMTRKGQIIFAVGAGLLVVLIRLKGGYPEGVCYSILLMNSVTPLIDRFTQPVKFGARR
jgi:electron transport complex protein RnfD